MKNADFKKMTKKLLCGSVVSSLWSRLLIDRFKDSQITTKVFVLPPSTINGVEFSCTNFDEKSHKMIKSQNKKYQVLGKGSNRRMKYVLHLIYIHPHFGFINHLRGKNFRISF